MGTMGVREMGSEGVSDGGSEGHEGKNDGNLQWK